MYTVLSDSEDNLVIALEGEIDHHTSLRLRQGIDEELFRVKPRRLTLDFGGVTFMDSSGIGLVMGRYRLLRTFGAELAVASVPKPLRRVMQAAGLTSLAKFEKGDLANENVQHDASQI